VAQWDGIPLVRNKDAVLEDQPIRFLNNTRTELLERLLADACELCGSREEVQVHHVRHLKDLERKGRPARPEWAKKMAARRRKTLVVCRGCHRDIHAGRPRSQSSVPDRDSGSRPTDTGEPGAVKVARPVCAVRRFVASLMQLGGTWRSVPGSPGLPGRESARGQEHARKAVVVRRRPGRRAARPAR
jgi:hypothetical protein